jgi:hypothetical protein
MMSTSDESGRYASKLHDRYAIAVKSSIASESVDSSQDSGTTSSSFDSSHSDDDETYLSEVSDTEIDTDKSTLSDTNEEVELLSTASLPVPMPGNWFDSACGWLDRPTLCLNVFTGNGNGHSLLKESKLKNSTVRNVKLNETMLKAARLAIKTAMAVKPVATTPGERRSIRLERKGLVEIARMKKEDRDAENAAETDNTKPEANNDAQEDSKKEAQDETMNKVQDDTKSEMQYDVNEETQSVASTIIPKPKEKELKVVKKKRIASFKNRLRNVKSEETIISGSSVASSRRQHHPQKQNFGENKDGLFTLAPKSQGTDQEGSGVNTRAQITASLEAELFSELKKEENQTNSLTNKEDMKGEMAEPGNELSKILDSQYSEDEDIVSTSVNEAWMKRAQIPEDRSIKSDESAVKREKSLTGNDASLIAGEAAITDLTHIDDDPSLQALPSLPSRTHEYGSSPIGETGLEGNQNKKIEVIDVFEFDDQDSWTPGEEKRALSPSQSKHSVRKYAFEKSRDPTPSKSTHASRMSRDPTPSKALFASKKDGAIARRVIDIWEEEEEKLKEFSTRNFSQGAKPQEPKLKTSSRKKIFDDPLAREDFAGHRRGRLGNSEKVKESRSRSKSKSRRQREVEKPPTPEDASVTNRRVKRSKSLEARLRLEELELENTLRKSTSRDSRYKETQPNASREAAPPVPVLEHRQWATESRHPSRESGRHEEIGDNESRMPKKKDLVAVRGIDEGQMLRTPTPQRNQELREKSDIRGPSAKSRDNTAPDAIQYGIDPTKSRETRHPIDEQSERSRGKPSTRSVRGPKSLHEREDRGVRSSGSRDYAEVISSTQGIVIHTSKSRDSHDRRGRSVGRDRPEIMDVTAVPDDYGIRKLREGGGVHRSKSRDSRDDHGTRHSSRHSQRRSGKEDPAGHFPNSGEYEDVDNDKSRRREKRSSRNNDSGSVISASKGLRRLEKKLGKQIMQVKQEHARNGAEWDERSVYSSKDLRKLEKQLVQKLKHDDEKRAVKLKRLRLKRESYKVNSGDALDISEKVQTKIIAQKAENSRREKTKFDQLQVLRSSKPMSKYISRSTSRTRGASPLLRPDEF